MLEFYWVESCFDRGDRGRGDGVWSLFVRVWGDEKMYIRVLELKVTSCIIIKVLEGGLVSSMFIRVMGVLERFPDSKKLENS